MLVPNISRRGSQLLTLMVLSITSVYSHALLPSPPEVVQALPDDSKTSAGDATAVTLAALITQAKQRQLAESPTWRRLLYFDEAASTSPYLLGNKHGKTGASAASKSKVTQSAFFLSPIGRSNPQAELVATLTGLMSPIDIPDESAACRFPARMHWIKQVLNIKESDIPVANCPKFANWYREINPHSATFIFASDFLNNPSSMFGHTLLRIDPPNASDKPLLSYAINYSAQTGESSGIAFAYNGLTGNYDGKYSILPYYKKVKEYGDFESRDLWEYQLDLTPEQTQQLVRHVWETKLIKFPYYFLSDNCSYELLGLIDKVTTQPMLTDDFKWHVIPAQTVRGLDKRQGLIKKTTYRAALETQLTYQLARYGNDLARLATQKADNPDMSLEHLPPVQQAQVLEMAYDELYLRYLKRQQDAPEQRKALHQLLIQRSRHPVPKQRTDVPTPQTDPRLGHNATRVGMGAGMVDGQGYVDAQWRLAYHDILDVNQGYRENMSVEALNTQIRISDTDVDLKQLDIVSVASYTPITPFQNVLSWGVTLGTTHVYDEFDALDLHSIAQAKMQYGWVTPIQSRMDSFCYAMGVGSVHLGRALDKGWRAGIAPKMGCLLQMGDNARINMDTELSYYLDGEQDEGGLSGFSPKLSLNWQYDVTTNQALRFNATTIHRGQLNDNQQKNIVDASLAWLIYY